MTDQDKHIVSFHQVKGSNVAFITSEKGDNMVIYKVGKDGLSELNGRAYDSIKASLGEMRTVKTGNIEPGIPGARGDWNRTPLTDVFRELKSTEVDVFSEKAYRDAKDKGLLNPAMADGIDNIIQMRQTQFNKRAEQLDAGREALDGARHLTVQGGKTIALGYLGLMGLRAAVSGQVPGVQTQGGMPASPLVRAVAAVGGLFFASKALGNVTEALGRQNIQMPEGSLVQVGKIQGFLANVVDSIQNLGNDPRASRVTQVEAAMANGRTR